MKCTKDLANDYDVLTGIIDNLYTDGMKLDPYNFHLNLSAANMFIKLAVYDPGYLDKAITVQETIEAIAPTSAQLLEIQIRTALLKNDDVKATELIEFWKEALSSTYQTRV